MVGGRVEAVARGMRAVNPGSQKNPESVVTPDGVTKTLKNLAKEFYLANQAANEYRAIADKLRKSLYVCMKETRTEKFEVASVDASDGTRRHITLDVALEAPEVSKVSAARLFYAMGADKSTELRDKFLQIVSATKKAVTDSLGTIYISRCEEIVPGTENVSVKKREK